MKADISKWPFSTPTKEWNQKDKLAWLYWVLELRIARGAGTKSIVKKIEKLESNAESPE